MNKLIVSIAFMLSATVGLEANAQQPLVVDELVAIVGDSPIMLSDVQRAKATLIEQLKINGIKKMQNPDDQAFELMLLNKFMLACARRDSLDKGMNKAMVADMIEETVGKMVDAAGGVKPLEKRYGKAIFQIKKDIEREMLENELGRMMQSKVRDEVAISFGDVSRFFDKLPKDSLPDMPPQYQYSQIVKMPEATEERKFEIREQLLGFRQRVLNGEKLSVLARLYSQDVGSKNRGGEMTFSSRELVPAFLQALEMLEAGQISEIVESEYGMHIIELISKKGDQYHFRHLLLKPEFTVDEEVRVITQLDSLKNEIIGGRLSFGTAADRYSNDKESAQNGGRVMNLRAYFESGGDISMAGSSFPLDELDPNDYRYLNQLKEGEMSIPYENIDAKGNRVYKIVRLDKKIPSHPASLDIDYDILAQITRSDKQNRELDKWIDKNIGTLYIYISPKYRNTAFDRKQWLETCLKYENGGLALKLDQMK